MTDPEWMVTCARCGRVIKGERSRLMWGADGTFRLCGPLLARKCDRVYEASKATP
jgi:hypothetical protein